MKIFKTRKRTALFLAIVLFCSFHLAHAGPRTELRSPLPPGDNNIGKMGIDQTTPGTTNGVQVNASTLPSGASTATLQSTAITSSDANFTAIKALIGEKQASPTENTLLDRLKDLLTGIILAPGSNKIGSIDTNATNGVSNTFTEIMKQGIEYTVQRGAINKFRQRPQILNEQQEESEDNIDVVESGVIVGQIIKASATNINSISLTAESAAARTELDIFATAVYTNDGALQTVWAKQGTDEAVRELTIKMAGSDMSMELDMSESDGDWLATTTAMPVNTSPIDLTGATIEFDYYQTTSFSNAEMAIYIEDSGANESEVDIVIAAIDTWQSFEIDISAFSGTADITDITKVGFRVNKKKVGEFGYVDNLEYIIPTGSIDIKLWDMGVSLPEVGVTPLDSGSQYTELGDRGLPGVVVASSIRLNLLGGKRMYHIHDFAAGPAEEDPANTLLTIGNYYAITLHYVDEDVTVYGYDGNQYTSGFSFYAPDTSTAIAATGANEDLMFYIFSTQQAYLTEYHVHTMDSTGAAAMPNVSVDWTVLVEDENRKVTVLSHHHGHPINAGGTAGSLVQDLRLRPVPLNKGGKFEIYYNADNDDVARIVVETFLLHEPSTPNN